MREKLGVLLMEDQNGEVAVQLFADADLAKAAYENLSGSPADPIRRATFISLKYGESSESGVHSKMLPVILDPDKQPDGYVLGQGPIHFEK